jgi:hypothetical protein
MLPASSAKASRHPFDAVTYSVTIQCRSVSLTLGGIADSQDIVHQHSTSQSADLLCRLQRHAMATQDSRRAVE